MTRPSCMYYRMCSDAGRFLDCEGCQAFYEKSEKGLTE